MTSLHVEIPLHVAYLNLRSTFILKHSIVISVNNIYVVEAVQSGCDPVLMSLIGASVCLMKENDLR